MSSSTPQQYNLLDLTPLRNLEWELSKDDRVVLLVPRFRNKALVKWLVPRLKRPTLRVTLDAYGSFIWRACDGRTSVKLMGEQLREQFGETVEPVFERIRAFMHELERGEVLLMHIPQPLP